MTAGHRHVLVAVTCGESDAALLCQHPRFRVVLTLPAPNGTGAPSVDPGAPPVDTQAVPPLLLDVSEVARRLSLSERSARQLIADGAVASVQVGRRRLVRSIDLIDYVNRLGAPTERTTA